MKAAIVTIGDEILIGQITDSNSAWLAGQLNLMGVEVSEMSSISDTPDHISRTLDRYIGTLELVILTGGLGPTKDDLTKKTLAEYFGGTMVMDKKVLAFIEAFFASRGRGVLPSNRDQAMVPDTCEALPNSQGTAPGMWFERTGTTVISVPGVPYEMKALMEEQIIPRLKERFGTPEIVHRTIMTQGVPESYLAEMIREWEEELPDCMKLAYLPRPGIVRLRLTVRGSCARDAQKILDQQIDKLQKIIPKHIYGYDEQTLQEALGKALKDNNLTVSTAESCTGGNIARLITSVPGSSDYFEGSVIAYSNRLKREKLGIPVEILDRYGAVSQQVAERMAGGVTGELGADCGIASSGVAGPGGGTDEKPVGTVWMAVSYLGSVESRKFQFGGSRERIIEQASLMGLAMMRKLIMQ